MKKTLLITFCCLFSAISFPQQNPNELHKEIKNKAIKEARKEAKVLTKAGWYPAPGSISLSRIIESTWMKMVMVDDDRGAKYLYADGNAVAQTKSVAEMQAIELGKLQLAGMIQTNISSLISANMGNAQLSTQEAASVTEVVLSSKNVISVELGYVDPSFKLFRNVGKENIEVQIRLLYDRKQSLEIAKKIIRQELKGKLKMNDEKLEKIIGI